jgi:hypothetical protein
VGSIVDQGPEAEEKENLVDLLSSSITQDPSITQASPGLFLYIRLCAATIHEAFEHRKWCNSRAKGRPCNQCTKDELWVDSANDESPFSFVAICRLANISVRLARKMWHSIPPHIATGAKYAKRRKTAV